MLLTRPPIRPGPPITRPRAGPRLKTWSLSSTARDGCCGGSDVWQWPAGLQRALSSPPGTGVAGIRSRPDDEV